MSRSQVPGNALRPEGGRAWRELLVRLDQALDAGRGVSCVADPAPFTSEERGDRLQAAASCSACPVLIECARFAVANREAVWVWGGVDLTPVRGVSPTKVRAELLKRAGVSTDGGEAA